MKLYQKWFRNNPQNGGDQYYKISLLRHQKLISFSISSNMITIFFIDISMFAGGWRDHCFKTKMKWLGTSNWCFLYFHKLSFHSWDCLIILILWKIFARENACFTIPEVEYINGGKEEIQDFFRKSHSRVGHLKTTYKWSNIPAHFCDINLGWLS